ncbi:MAG: hypothetical protein ABSG80_01380 [Verrucomicrobiota bacterium]
MKRPFDLMIVLGVIFLTASCATDTERKIYKTTAELNDVEKSLNYWGKVAMSEPVFIENKGQFKVAFNEDATNYVQAARSNISGASRSALETSLYLGLALQGQVTPPISTSLAASSNSTNQSGGASLPNQAGGALNAFTPLLASGALAPAIDERQAVQKGINDKIAEQLLAFMANPSVSNSEQQIVFGVMQITCQPGQNTKHGYLADLNVSLGYGRIPDTNSPYKEDTDGFLDRDGIQENTNCSPGIFAVLPLVDSRNVELQNSDRSQIELASALSVAFAAKGINAAAKSLSDYVKRQESDMETRNSLPVVTSYTDGSTFGFQIYPSFQAIENPSKAKSADDVLEPITFPAVVAIIINKEAYYYTTTDYSTNYYTTNHDEIITNRIEVTPGNRLKNPWNYLVTESETRWIPFKHPYFVNHSPFDRFLMDSWLFKRLTDPSLSDRVRRAQLIGKATDALDSLATNKMVSDQHEYQFQCDQLKIARDSLETTALGLQVERPLPSDLGDLFTGDGKTNKPSITDVFPHAVWRDTNTTFTIILKGVTSSDITDVNIAGVSCQANSSYSYTEGTNSGVVLNVTLPNIFYNTANASNTVEFVVLAKNQPPISKVFTMPLQGKIAPEAIATVNRDTSGKVSGLDIKPGQNLTEQQLLDAIKDVLEKSEPVPITTTIIK